MTIFAIDTCSLIALDYSGYLEIIIKNVELVITNKIVSELEDISRFTDDDGRAAEDVLRLLSGITIIETMPKSSGEEELIEVVRQNKCDLTVSDDLRAIPKFNTVNSSITKTTLSPLLANTKGIWAKTISNTKTRNNI